MASVYGNKNLSSDQAGNTLVNKMKDSKENEPVLEENGRRQGKEKAVDFFRIPTMVPPRTMGRQMVEIKICHQIRLEINW